MSVLTQKQNNTGFWGWLSRILFSRNKETAVNPQPKEEPALKEEPEEIHEVEEDEPIVVEETWSKPIDLKVTLINSDCLIKGSVECGGRLKVLGAVEGDVVCEHDLCVEGKIIGDIEADEIDLKEAEVKGNLNIEKDIRISKDSGVTGDINADNAVIDGNVTGNISVNDLKIQKNAMIKGDIDVETINILQGSKINGNVTMRKE